MYYPPNNQNAISSFSQVAVSDQDNYSIQNQFLFHKLTGSYSYNHIDTPVFRGATYYRGNRGDIKHIVNYSNSEAEHSYQLDTAFVYADGHLGIGRHVVDSFALLYAPENISYKYIEFKGNLRPMAIEIKKSTSTIISLGTLIAHE